MKSLYLILIILVALSGTYAQTTINSAYADARIKALERFLQGSAGSNKIAATAERIIGLRVNHYTSGAWQPSDSVTFTYIGEMGHPSPSNSRYAGKVDYKWSGGNMENERRITRTFDASNRPMSLVTELWTGSAYENYKQTLFNYDQFGYIQTYLYQDWNGSVWVNSALDSFVNLSDGTNIYQSYQYWNGNSWVFENRFRSWYTASGQLDSLSSEFWSSGVFDVVYETKWIYNSSDQLIEEIEKFNGDFDDEHEFYYYDANGNDTLHLIKRWNGSAWEDDQRFLSSYNAANQLTVSVSETMDSGTWVPSLRFTTAYHANGYRSEYTSETWNDTTSVWEGYQKTFYTYDANNNADVTTVQIWSSGVWVNSTRTDAEYNGFNNLSYILAEEWDAGNWVNDREEFRYYEEHEATGVKDVANATVKVYPNPATTLLHIEITPGTGPATLEVFNINGQKLLTAQTTKSAYGLNIETLASGFYLLKVTQGSTTNYGRFVKE